MDRVAHRRLQLLLVLVMAAGVGVAATGCVSALATAVYVIRGTNVDAEYEGLKGKKVAVVCRPPVQLQFSNSSVSGDLAKQIGLLLGEHVKKIEIIDHREVAKWTDENSLDDLTEPGRALDAEMLVAVDLESFELQPGQTLLQGSASGRLLVYDLSKQGDIPVFEKVLPSVKYPPNGVISTSEKNEAQFKGEFVRVLAETMARHFYDHDARADFALDSTALN